MVPWKLCCQKPIQKDFIGWDRFRSLCLLLEAPARDTGLSPYEFVYGRQARTTLDLLHVGWNVEELDRYKVCEWK